MGLGAGSTVNRTSLGPPTFQLPYITQAFGEAQRLYQQPGPTLYPNPMVADFTPTQLAGQQMITDAARQAQGTVGGMLNAISQGLQAPDVGNNPYLGQMADAITQRVNQAVGEQWLPRVRSGAVATGTMGGSRQALAEGLVGREASRELSNALANLYGNQYNMGMNTMLQTLGIAPMAMQGMAMPGFLTSAVGEQQRALEQAKIDEAVMRWAHEQNLPYQKLAEFYNIISRPVGSTGESTVTAEGGGGGLGLGLGILGWLLEWLRGGGL